MTDKRIVDLEQILTESINLSSNIVIDEPTHTFRATLGQLRDFLNNVTYPVGTVLWRADDQSPSKFYGGKWELITAKDDTGNPVNAVLGFGSGVACDLKPEGENEKEVPVGYHTHGAQSESTFLGERMLEHSHTQNVATGEKTSGMGGSTASGSAEPRQTTKDSAGIPSGTVTTVTNILPTGDRLARMNVEQATIKLNAWLKVGD